MLLFRSRFPGSSPSLRPGFPCLPSGSVCSALCQFPFALPCFAPTAVPQVIAWLSSFRPLTLALSPSFPLPFVRFFSGSHYLAFRSSFPFFPFLPHGGFPGARLSAFPSVCFHTSVSALVLSFSAFPFTAHCFALQRYLSCQPPVSSSAVPLAFALGSGYSARVMHPQN